MMKQTAMVEDIKEVEDSYGHVHHITGELSRGGQGAVLKTQDPQILIKVAIEDDEVVLDDSRNEEYTRLRLLPIPAKLNVTMPMATLKGIQGYLMQMLGGMTNFADYFSRRRTDTEQKSTSWMNTLGERRKDFVDYYNSGGERKRLEAFMKSGILLAELHSQGLVYGDYSGNNVFISKDDAYTNVWLIDSDNLKPEGKSKQCLVYTPGIAPPELLQFDDEWRMGDSISPEDRWGCGNTFASDAFTYAICLFKELTLCNPFDGKLYKQELDNCNDSSEAHAKLDRCEYPYIHDVDDHSNEGGFFPYDTVMTLELQDLFQQTFCEAGRYYKWNRPTMHEWANVVARAYDKVIRCHSCGMDYVHSSDEEGNVSPICPWCDAPKSKTFRLYSYLWEGDKTGALIWEYQHELTDGEVMNIPMRLFHNFTADEIDTVLLKARFENNYLVISPGDGTANIKFSFSEAGKNYSGVNQIKTSSQCFFMKLLEVDTERVCLVEGEIK